MESGHVLTGRGADSSASLPASLRTQPDPAIIVVPKGTWFDEAVDFRDPEGDALTREVLALIAAVETRARRRRQTDERNHQTAVRRVLANGLRCHYFRRPTLVAHYRKADGYPDGPDWLSGEAMGRTVDLLMAAGLLDTSIGHRGVVASTYSVTAKLCEIARACGITDSSLTVHLPFRSLVRLRKGNSQTPQVEYVQTPQTFGWKTRLLAYNRFVARQDIALKLTAEEAAEWVRHRNKERKEGGVHLRNPELIQTDLYRQFNNGSFEEGGRLYGGWWIDTPKTLRPKITINGAPTVELDFSGCAIRMLYHERRLPYQGDPYWLEAIAAYENEAGLTPGHFREAIKKMTQALINGKGGKPEMIRLPNGLSFHPRFKRRDVRQMIEKKHDPIADAFGTGAGLRLQRKESDLALSIVIELMNQKIVSLPVHDSFLVERTKRSLTGVMMSKIYDNMFGFHPEIK